MLHLMSDRALKESKDFEKCQEIKKTKLLMKIKRTALVNNIGHYPKSLRTDFLQLPHKVIEFRNFSALSGVITQVTFPTQVNEKRPFHANFRFHNFMTSKPARTRSAKIS